MSPHVANGHPAVVLAHARDAELTVRVIRQAGMPCEACASHDAFLARILEDTIACAVIAEEALDAELLQRLTAAMVMQPTWSDLPFVVVAASNHRESLLPALRRLGNIAVLTRPMAPDALASAVEAALRARARQLQVKQLLDEQADQVRRRDELLMMLAHELRNPLAPVRYAAQVLQEPTLSPRQRQSAIDVIARQSAHMGELIDRMLEVFRASRGLEKLHLVSVCLAEVAREALQAITMRTGRTVNLEESGSVWVRGDRGRLRQVLDNLLDNAIKFSPAHSAATVRVRAQGGEAMIEVRDEGDGIDPLLMQHVFEPFTQGAQSLARQGGGLGLGLALVRALVQLHGGEVAASSEGPGRGSVFRVTLPRVDEPAQVDEPAANEDDCDAPRRVLVAEDNIDAAESLQMLLELHGHEVRVVHDGRSALDAVRADLPDVLVCDIGLPELTGYEVARAVCAHSRRPKLIAVTGYGSEEDRDRALEAGFDVHMGKPVDPTRLIAEVCRPKAHSA